MSAGDRKVIAEGICECTLEPYHGNGNHGLEGYNRGDKYAYQEMQSDNKYFRVFPEPRTTYYETCSPQVFNKFFEIKKRKRI